MMSLNIRIPDDLAIRLGDLAEQTGRTKSYYLRAALEEKLEEMEDYFLALQAIQEIETGKAQVVSHKEVKEKVYSESKMDD